MLKVEKWRSLITLFLVVFKNLRKGALKWWRKPPRKIPTGRQYINAKCVGKRTLVVLWRGTLSRSIWKAFLFPAITVRRLSGLETPFQCTFVPIIKLPNFEGKYLSGQSRKCTPPKMPTIIFGLHSLRGDFPPQGKCFQKCPFLWSWGALFSPLLLITHLFRNRRIWSYHVTKEHNKWFGYMCSNKCGVATFTLRSPKPFNTLKVTIASPKKKFLCPFLWLAQMNQRK